MKKILASSAAVTLALTAQVFAQSKPGDPAPTPVPEISALEGVAALALVAAVVAIVWERRRRSV